MKYPRITTPFDHDPEARPYYVQGVEQILGQVLPPDAFFSEHFHTHLPLVTWSPLGRSLPFNLSFYLCCYFRENAFRFFSEMIRRWLIPGKQMNAMLQFAVDFMLPDISSDHYIAGHVAIHVALEKELELITRNLPMLESELKMGVESPYQATRIMEIRGLSYDEKTTLIQESITKLVKHRPQDFDYDVLSEMQHFLVVCRAEFKLARTARHMSRVICSHYLFRKALKLSYEVFPERRYISVKLMRAKLNRTTPVLGIVIGMSYLREDEVFEARHILSAAKTVVPGLQKVEGSYFINQGRSDPICTLYLEVEKEGGISLEEERILKEELPIELKSRIEHRQNPIFMPQNEEEVMRFIVTLANQLTYVRDLPQVIIDFTQQTGDKLEFLVVALRVKTEQTAPLNHFFELKPTFLEYLPNRCKIVGSIRKRYKKEATVFHLRIKKAPFLRQDHSVDLYKARREIVNELRRVIGDFRDYNGGTISKETELFHTLRHALGDLGSENHFLLENFFFSINPAVMRSIMPVECLQKLFQMVVDAEIEGISNDQAYQIRMEEENENFYLLVTALDASFSPRLTSALSKLEEVEMANCLLQSTELPCFGVICRSFAPEEVRQLRMVVEECMSAYEAHALGSKKISSFFISPS